MTDLYLGISQGYHDAGLALVNANGHILHASHSERYSKVKNDPNLHYHQFQDCEFTGYETVTVNYYERPWLTNLRRLYAGQKLKSISPVINKLKYFDLPRRMNKWGHHLSHAAAAFQTSPFTRSAVVVIDAIGEWDTASIWYAYYDDITGLAKYQKLWSKKYPHSIGLFYTAMTQRVGLRPMEDEYVLMGMAAYGNKDALYKKMYNDFIDQHGRFSFKRNLHRGCKHWAPNDLNYNIAAAAQTIAEELILEIHQKAADITQETNVCYGGGVALNCVANNKLRYIWSNVWICPNPGDCGSALGAAALGYGRKLNWQNAFLGENIVGYLNVSGAVDVLLTEKIVGVANGYAEWGPRALGNRSLLADPRGTDIKDRVNEIKQRQKYRPFAPAVLTEHADKYFELDKAYDYRYMQYAVQTKEETQKLFPAICHVDGTARVQVVPDDGSNMRKILEAWYEKTGCPMLLNTSLNIRGKPIVNNRKDAYDFAATYGVKVIT
jgi:carbamoyltransferase